MKWGCYHSYQLLFATLSLTPNRPPLWWPFLLRVFFGYSQIYWYTWLLTNTVSYLWHLIVGHQLFKDVNFSCQPQINSNHLRNLTLHTHTLTHKEIIVLDSLFLQPCIFFQITNTRISFYFSYLIFSVFPLYANKTVSTSFSQLKINVNGTRKN